MRRLIFALGFCLTVRCPAFGDELDFNRDVRPILSDKCYACHGPDAEQRQADLRLDTREGAFQDLGGYAAVVAGDPEASQLLRRVRAENDEPMPPADHPKQLTEAEKQTLEEWIRQGATWSAHWAYEPPQRHAPPIADDWCRNWIDAFVLQQILRAGISPSEPAAPRTLLRRLSFDLTGLPPTPSQVADLERDSSEENYQAHVDRLLRSPHFGERLASYWLDLVRYADTVGYHGDQDVSVSPYRDYVIQAFNSNKPFDEFTREQLAGDLLPQPTPAQLVASGYNKLGMMSAEGGVQPEEYLVKYAADRVRTASTVWLGSTLGCAECHNHKFDPFTARDFYRFAAFFADIKERGLYSGANRDGNWGPSIEVSDPELPALLAPIEDKIARLEHELLVETTAELEQAEADWVARQEQALNRWQVLRPSQVSSQAGSQTSVQEDGAVLVSGKSPVTERTTVGFELPAGTRSLRLDALPHPSLPQQGPGRAGNGNFVVTELRLAQVVGEEAKPVSLGKALATIEQRDDNPKNPWGKWPAAATIDSDQRGKEWGWAVLPDIGQPQALVVVSEEALQGGTYQLVIEQRHSNPRHTLGHFRLASSRQSVSDASELIPLQEDLRGALAKAAEKRSESDLRLLREAFRQQAAALEPLRARLAAARDEAQALKAQHTRSMLITRAVEPRETRVLPRGNWMDRSGEVVAPGVPHFLPQLDDSRRLTRLDLADWLTHEDNPLTARVFVNRLWKLFFGTGLSKVLDDLGAQGELPSHPELLDALAVEFVDSGWDIKHMVKLIVMSNTYRQSSLMREELRSLDPYNRLLARQSRFRLEAEFVRDNALAVSGLLVGKVGGRSVKPYQPEGLYRHLNFPPRTYEADTGMNQYRRGLYTHWQRQFLHPAMQAFDAPSREECTAERPRSNTPLAALVLLNDPSYVEAARTLAARGLQQADDPRDILQWLVQQALAREPRSEEADILLELYAAEKEAFQTRPQAVEQFVGIGQSRPPEGVAPLELAAWTNVCRSLLNMHEFVTRN